MVVLKLIFVAVKMHRYASGPGGIATAGMVFLQL